MSVVDGTSNTSIKKMHFVGTRLSNNKRNWRRSWQFFFRLLSIQGYNVAHVAKCTSNLFQHTTLAAKGRWGASLINGQTIIS